MSGERSSSKVPSFISFSPYRAEGWKVDALKEELKSRQLPVTGKKEDLLRRLERHDDIKSGKADYSAWKIIELKEECHARGISGLGSKVELILRLEEFDKKNGTKAALEAFSKAAADFSPVAEHDSKEFELSLNSEEAEQRQLHLAGEQQESNGNSNIDQDGFKLVSPRKTLAFESSPNPSPPNSPIRKPLVSTPTGSPSLTSKTKNPTNRFELLSVGKSPSPKPSRSSEILNESQSQPAKNQNDQKPKAKEATVYVVPVSPNPAKEKQATKPLEATPTRPNPAPQVTQRKASPSPSQSEPKSVEKVEPTKSNGSGSKELEELAKKHHEELESLHLLQSPLRTLKYFGLFTLSHIRSLASYSLENFSLLLLLLFAAIIVFILSVTEGPHSWLMTKIEKFILWYGGWVMLGVASSAGIGSGLHTFLLYLGPFIASATVKAYACGSADVSVTEDSNIFSIDLTCNTPPPENPILFISLVELVNLVKWESFCWGAGTAIGELPPFFLARAAALAGERAEDNEEFAEIQQQLQSGKKLSLATRMKVICLNLMKSLGFFGIVLLASVPNPLFDLAGIFSGLLKFSFWKFFGATLIGKAVIKVSLQTMFVVITFSKPTFELFMEYVRYVCQLEVIHNFAPKLFETINDSIEATKAKYENPDPTVANSKSLFSYLFDIFFYIVLGIFLVSIIQSFAVVQLKIEQHRELSKLERKLERKKALEAK